MSNQVFSKQTLETLANHIETLQDGLPRNSRTGAPQAYIDPTNVAETITTYKYQTNLSTDSSTSQALTLQADTQLELLEESSVPLDYSEGYPTINGLPFWERLDGEINDYYKMFKHYRDQPIRGQKRAIYRTAQEFDTQPYVINAIKTIYQWEPRIQAYDQYRQLEREAQRAQMIQDMEHKHANAAKELFDTCTNFLYNHMDELSPKVALQWAKMAVELERLSLGLEPDSPSSKKPNSVQQTLIQINENANASNSNGGSGGRLDKGEQHRMQEILDILGDSGVIDVESGTNGDDTDTNSDTNTGRDRDSTNPNSGSTGSTGRGEAQ